MTDPTRLHIIPLTPDLLPSVLPPSVLSAATDISFHTIPTFPENNYGYVTLPTMEAEKIKKKLNGKILKGKKFQIETARPQKRQIEEEEADPAPTKEKRKSKKHKSEDKKDKKEKQSLEGYELPSDRKVKRGWTDPNSGKRDKHNYDKDKKKNKEDKKDKPQPKSKYSENPECLFRTSIPANRASQTEDDKKAKKNKKTPDNVVHEFAKTYSHPSFLREKGDDSVPTTEFDEEKGWVDSTGTVKEPPSEKARKKDYRPGAVAGFKEKRPVVKVRASKTKSQVENPESSAESDDYTSSSGSSDESSDSKSESEDENEKENEGNNSSDDSDSSADEEESDKPETPKVSTKTTNDDTMALDDDSKSEVADKPAQNVDESSLKEVHPLEALFKRPAAPAEAEEKTAPAADAGFSFFGNADDIESEDEQRFTEPQTPFTPYNKRELQDRGLRSAAPTPDTALASRHMKYMEDDDEEEEEEDVAFDTPVSKSREADGKKDETQFAKWFWENRGDNNRAWKKRRRDAAKEQRQRDNRKKGMKGRS
ncbi:Nucleotide-binding alpha-beta plait [Penicillium angulare]|uniref:Nucleotide-binding alpha-beta plait n=1 Tax=Penicillium angulare TaxID=116970 RepID=UPI00253FB830|nr:Nucleotide-binding alpha-beta plait [Penicillium angulare]KAJ5286871.1 Nucleotide-binding alpha-beta plait [Penicillium angulare]